MGSPEGLPELAPYDQGLLFTICTTASLSFPRLCKDKKIKSLKQDYYYNIEPF